jgi:hypothetical protein
MDYQNGSPNSKGNFYEIINVDGLAKRPSISPAIGGTGVGATPMAWDGFTPPGGGGEALHRLVKWLEEIFYEVLK